MAMTAITDCGHGDLLLPKILPLKQLARMGAELNKVYEVGTSLIKRMRGEAAPGS